MFELAKNFSLEMSLFERLVNMGLPYVRLNYQVLHDIFRSTSIATTIHLIHSCFFYLSKVTADTCFLASYEARHCPSPDPTHLLRAGEPSLCVRLRKHQGAYYVCSPAASPFGLFFKLRKSVYVLAWFSVEFHIYF